MTASRLVRCQICQQEKLLAEVVPAALIRDDIVATLKAQYPAWDPHGYVCTTDLNRARAAYVERLLADERGELSAIEQEVLHSLRAGELIAEDVDATFDQQQMLGGRLADRIAQFGGSWRFIGLFAAILLAWMLINSGVLLARPFDPYPFILLNLVLSCMAAIQAPIIMMSQNRQEDRDRLHAAHDYQVNLKAELEVRQLHEKLDHLMTRQWQRLAEIQQVQLDVLDNLMRTVRSDQQAPRREGDDHAQ